MANCPSCNSESTRRGGMIIWLTYLALIAFAVPATLIFHLNAAIIATIMVVVAVLVNVIVNQRVCRDCGHQWRA